VVHQVHLVPEEPKEKEVLMDLVGLLDPQDHEDLKDQTVREGLQVVLGH